ncbi:hypothetical protein GCM10009633_23850 [Janibacter melonis]|uniref:hypothetical protein n=1 Tax=Janibacter melonis TaxID=262209 RepID=UPI001E355643|nr:hypothetical protein [Janibacter melonis]MCB5993214.1 hypothetical protein [Janibacter melonis]
MTDHTSDEIADEQPAPPDKPYLGTKPTKWAQDDHVRLIVTGFTVAGLPVLYLAMLVGVLTGQITVEEMKELGGVELFSGLIALAGTVVGYYFGKRD